MKTTKKLLALLLALVMLMSAMPMGAFAVEADETVETTAATEADTVETTEVTEEPETTAEPTVEATTEATTEATEEPVEETTDPTETTEIALLDADELIEVQAVEDEGLGLTEYAAPDTSGDPLYKILHIDAARKYLSPATLRDLVNQVKANGMNQINLYLSDNQGLRFGITDSEGNFIIRANDTEYDLTGALGYYDNSAAEPSKSTDRINRWLSTTEMEELIRYAASQGVDIIPCINMPGHMAAILQGSDNEEIKSFCKTFDTHYSNESLDMGNTAAVNFALALLQTYCDWFAGIKDGDKQLVKYFCIGADEYGQDLFEKNISSGFGTAYMEEHDEYDYLVKFLNRAGNVIKSYDMTPRAFNDAFLSDGNTDAGVLGLNTDYQLYYWGGGWGGMKNAYPDVLNKNGFKVINCNYHYYYICCASRPFGQEYIDTPEAIRNNPFELKTFATGAVNFDPVGAMFCIWCDQGDGGASHENDITTNGMEVMTEWANCLSATPDESYEYVEKSDDTGVKIGATGLSEISVSEVSNPEIPAAKTDRIVTYSMQMSNAQRDYTGSYRISLPIPADWNSAKVRGFTVGDLVMPQSSEATLPVREASGSVKGSYYVLDVDTPYAAVGIYEAADAEEGKTVVNITLSVGDTYDFGGTLTGDYQGSAGETYGAFKIEVTDFVAAVPGIPAVAPKAIDMSTVDSDQEYLISDGNGNYLSFTAPSTIINSTDPLTATKWKVTVNSDRTYSLSTSYVQWSTTYTVCLALQTWSPYILVTGSTAANFTYDSESGLYTHLKTHDTDNDFYLEYTGSSWALTKDAVSGSAAAICDLGKEGTPGTPATTTLLLTATNPGTTSVTIGGTVYNVTVIAGVSEGHCEEHKITVSGHGVDGLKCAKDNTVTSINGYENINVEITGYSLTPTVGDADYKGEVQVKMPIPAGWTEKGGIIQAFLKQDTGTAVAIPVTIENGYATYTVPGGTVSGLFKLPADYYTKEVNVLMGNDSEVIRTQPGAYTDSDVYYCDEQGLVTVTSKVTSPYVPAVPAGAVSTIEVGKEYYITDGKGNYLTIVDGNMANTQDIAEAAKWKCEENSENTYKLMSNGYQLANCSDGNTPDGFYTTTSGGGSHFSPTFDPGSGLYKNGWYLVFDGTNWISSAESTGHGLIYGTGSDAVPAQSTVTIKSGATTGKTSVIVGTVKYNITIKDKKLVEESIRIYSMITNDLVLIGGTEDSPVCHVDINAAMENGINSEEGIDITKLFPAEAVRGDDKVVFWKMTWLPNGHRQSTETGSPYLKGEYADGVKGDTNGGQTGYENRVDFTRLRYWENGWELYLDADQDAWNTTTKWGTEEGGFVGWYPINPTEEDVTTRMPGATAGEGQIVAYYLQETAVTQEVTTNVADWGPAIGDSRNLTYGGEYVLLDFAVRYEDGVRNPNEIGTFPYSDGSCNGNGTVTYTTDKTMSFHCNPKWDGVQVKDDGNAWRTINTIMATTDTIRGYEIYMITATDSYETTPLSPTGTAENKRNPDGTGGYDYDTKTETIVWLKDEDTEYSEEFKVDPNVAYGYRKDGTHTNHVPLVNSVEIQMQHAKLITYYVRYVGVTEDDLYVHYIDITSGQEYEFYNYGIHVTAGTEFDKSFARKDDEYGLTGNTVTNFYGVTQTVQGDPRNILDVPSFYRSTQLNLVSVKRDENGKHLYLYYNIDNAKDMVIDFGLPVEITKDSLQVTLSESETLRSITAVGAQSEDQYSVKEGAYGYFYTDASGKCYYIPTSVMRKTESTLVRLDTSETRSSSMNNYAMSIFPATTMYYEEYFAEYEGAWTSNFARPEMGADYVKGYSTLGNQQGAYPGMTDAYNYGYDGVYDTAQKTQATTTTPGSKATFEFTGNGFEVYADCTSETGTVAVGLYKVTDGTDTLKSVYLVDTIRKSGGTALTEYKGESQNTPIVSVRDLEYGDYKVVMILTKYTENVKFVFDGFRVFNTMNDTIDEKVYKEDAESQPEFVEVRDCVLFAKLPKKDDISNKSVYIDQIAEGVSSQVYNLKGDQKVNAVLMTPDGEIEMEPEVVTDYLDNGTKNEVYVRPGQYLLITLPDADIAAKTQIGMKTLTGITTYGDKTISQTNMYYKGMNDGKTITISNPSDAKDIISITDLKIPGGIPAGSTTDTQSLQSGVEQALLQMGYKEEPKPTEPTPTEPEVTEPKTTEPTPTEPKATEPKPTEPTPTEPKVTEPKPTEPAPTEPKATEPKPTEPAPTEPKITEPKPTEPGNGNPGDTYVSGKAYHRGDIVVFNGKTYRAKWWTRGENPETSQVWELVGDGNQTAAPAFWSPFKIYTAGMQVTYKGHVYEAKWWTIGLAPGKGWWSAWKQIS